MYHLHREIVQEIDHNLQLVTYCLYTTEITKVQEWILVELHREYVMNIYMELSTG